MPPKKTPKQSQQEAASRSLAAKTIASKGQGSKRVYSSGRTKAEKKADTAKRAANTSIQYDVVGHRGHFVLGAADGEVLADASQVPILRSKSSTGKRSPAQRNITEGWAGKPNKRSLG